MNLNPFVYSYKHYPNSKLATMVSNFCGGMQRIFFIVSIIIFAVIIFGDVENWGEALIFGVVMLGLWLLLKLKKGSWSDKVAAKQESVDNPNNSEEK